MEVAGSTPVARSNRTAGQGLFRCPSKPGRAINCALRHSRKHTPDQIVRKLREAARAPGRRQAGTRGLKAPRDLRADPSRWRKQFGGLKANDAKRLRELAKENTRRKRIVADKELEIDALREVAKGNF